jgi:predicted DCC family thiol-disulfide oxidoreductase YuxK
LLRFPGLLRLLTFATLAIEVAVPVLLFSPWRPRAARAAAVGLMVALQVGLLLCLHLGHFPWVALVAALPLIPSWDWWGRCRTGRPPGVEAVYYDGGCAFCRKAVAVLATFVLPPETAVRPAQDDPRVLEAMRREDSWIVVDRRGTRFVRGAALAAILRRSAWWPLALPLECRPGARLADVAYRWVARRRASLSRLVAPFAERPYRVPASRPAGVLAVFFILYIFWWNLGTVSARLAMPASWGWIGMASRTDQRWDMFAPYPLRDDGWYVIDGVLHSGRHVDVFRGGAPVSYATPSPGAIAAQYRDERWRKYLMNLYLAVNSDYRLYYGRYLCRSWNERRPASDPDDLDRFQIYFMVRTTTLWNERPEPYRRILLYSHHCF